MLQNCVGRASLACYLPQEDKSFHTWPSVINLRGFESQTRITQLKAAIETMPTLAKVEEEVLAAEAEMASAKACKNYRRAAELTRKLPEMQERHSAMALSSRKAMSRKQLSDEIQRLEGEASRGNYELTCV